MTKQIQMQMLLFLKATQCLCARNPNLFGLNRKSSNFKTSTLKHTDTNTDVDAELGPAF